jgi:N-methylhydantoinase A
VEVSRDAIRRRDAAAIAQGLHREHNRLYGYSLEHEGAPIEIINVRVQAIGSVDKLAHPEGGWRGDDAASALKGRRDAYVPEDNAFRSVPVYDGHRLGFGHRIAGPAIVEQATTAVVLTGGWDALVDRHGSFVLYRKGREDLVAAVAESQEALA